MIAMLFGIFYGTQLRAESKNHSCLLSSTVTLQHVTWLGYLATDCQFPLLAQDQKTRKSLSKNILANKLVVQRTGP